MAGSYHNPLLQWIVILILECTFLGFCIIFIGAGVSELRKKKNPFKNITLIIVGIIIAILSVAATTLLLQGRM